MASARLSIDINGMLNFRSGVSALAPEGQAALARGDATPVASRSFRDGAGEEVATIDPRSLQRACESFRFLSEHI